VNASKPQGVILWFTGLSGVGKSTLARRVGAELNARRAVEVLDGDEVRRALSPDLGFSKADRDLHVGRLGFVARAVARTGAVAICAAISPYAAARDAVRAQAIADGSRFVEVALHAPLEVLTRRDPKGLYARAISGQLPGFTGVSDPYEPPQQPELRLDTSVTGEDACVAALMRVLE
jgi:adenylyl-sulfate kinase